MIQLSIARCAEDLIILYPIADQIFLCTALFITRIIVAQSEKKVKGYLTKRENGEYNSDKAIGTDTFFLCPVSERCRLVKGIAEKKGYRRDCRDRKWSPFPTLSG